jgi:lysyl-tRNA synthetase, class II
MYNFNKQQLQKVQELREQGINPYPTGISNCSNSNVIARLSELSVIELEFAGEYSFTGRLRFKNEMGKMGFGRIDSNGVKFQFSVKKNIVSSEDFTAWKKLDLGDWVYVSGKFYRTRTGELTLEVEKLKLYSKCMESMPDKHVGLTDPESKHRMRYLDLIVNQDSRSLFMTRSRIVSFLRRHLEDHGYMEVETPLLQTIPGGASAQPFVTHHNALDADLYMRIAPELYLKRLIVGGFERVFEIGKNFRNEGLSTKHNPEFTMVEFYCAHVNYQDLMCFTEDMITELVETVCENSVINYNGTEINFRQWNTISFIDSLINVGVVDPWCKESIHEFLNSKGVEFKTDMSVSDLQQLVFDQFVEGVLINPTFITLYPTELSPLARKNDGDPRVTDRFELFIHGMEIANGFNELNDPVDQADRFNSQVARRDSGDDEAMYFDDDYIKALSYAMPPTSGQGIGIDRLVMLLTNSTNIRDVILFPTMKRKV